MWYYNVRSIDKETGDDITFTYAPDGNRISKLTDTRNTYYVRDASGNIMATYTLIDDCLTLDEHPLYGSSRLGVRQKEICMDDVPTADPDFMGIVYVERGWKKYELSNHLGNVLTVITDRRSCYGTYDEDLYYEPDIVTITDYYPFGSPMEVRTENQENYRFGFNRQENDNEIHGIGNVMNYEYRICDSRLGRFFSVDPLTRKFPWNTPYAYAENKVIQYVELEGLQTDNAMLAARRVGIPPAIIPYLRNPASDPDNLNGEIKTTEHFQSWYTRQMADPQMPTLNLVVANPGSAPITIPIVARNPRITQIFEIRYSAANDITNIRTDYTTSPAPTPINIAPRPARLTPAINVFNGNYALAFQPNSDRIIGFGGFGNIGIIGDNTRLKAGIAMDLLSNPNARATISGNILGQLGPASLGMTANQMDRLLGTAGTTFTIRNQLTGLSQTSPNFTGAQLANGRARALIDLLVNDYGIDRTRLSVGQPNTGMIGVNVNTR